MKFVNNRVMKKDAMSLVTGQAVYTDDIAPKGNLEACFPYDRAFCGSDLRTDWQKGLIKSIKRRGSISAPFCL